MDPMLAVVASALGMFASNAAAPSMASETARSGAVQATVKYHLRKSNVWYVRLAVARSGQRRYDRLVPPLQRPGAWNEPIGVWRNVGIRNARTITLRDLDGNGEPEILLDFWTGGAHCCYWTRIYHWNAAAKMYRSFVQFWGNFGYRLVDVNHSGHVELVSADNRFAYAFASFAGSGAPVQVWNFRGGRLVDTTRTYSPVISNDARRWWRLSTKERYSGEVRGVLAAWVADEALLGRGRAALAWLWRHRFVLAGRYDKQKGSVARYLSELRIFLRRTGYLR